jgi:hypothetical protein
MVLVNTAVILLVRLLPCQEGAMTLTLSGISSQRLFLGQ